MLGTAAGSFSAFGSNGKRWGMVNSYPSARYWRIYCLHGTSNVQYSNIEFHETVGGPDVTGNTGGSAIASGQYNSTYTPSKAFDSSSSSKWAESGDFRVWIGWDFGPGEKRSIREVQFTTILSGQKMDQAVVDFSDDGVNWSPLCGVSSNRFSLSSPELANGTSNYELSDQRDMFVEHPATTAFRYWRLFCFQSDGGGNRIYALDVIELRDGAGNDLCATVGGTASASSAQGAYPASAAFAGNSGYWATGESATGQPEWIQWDFGSGNEQIVSELHLKARASGSVSPRAPAGYFLQGSNDGSEWTTVLYRRGQTFGWSGTNTYTL